jgi:hypothetical protein
VIAVAMDPISQRFGSILDLALSMSGYTQGALLAALLLALARVPIGGSGLAWSAPLSVAGVFAIAWHGPRGEIATLAFAIGFFAAWVFVRVRSDAARGIALRTLAAQTFALGAGLALLVWIERHGLFQVERNVRFDPEYDWLPLAFPWYVPAGCAIAYGFGHLLARPNARGARASDRFADDVSAASS